MKKKVLLFVFLLSIGLFSCKGPEGYIDINKLDYSIEHSKAPYDVYFYVDVDFYGDDNDLKVYWDFGDRTGSNEIMPVHTYYENKVYTVTLQLTNYQTTITRKLVIDLDTPHVPVARFEWYGEPDNPDMVAPVEVKFYNFSRFADKYFWNFGDGLGSDEPEPTHLYETPDYYYVTLTVYSGDDTVRATDEIEVNQPYKK